MVAVGGVAGAHALGLALPPCPLRWLTGLPCPGCGSGRCLTALLEGDVVGALDHNVLVPFALVVLLWSAAAAVAGRTGRRLMDPLQARHASRLMACVVGLFWLARLVPWGPGAWLAP